MDIKLDNCSVISVYRKHYVCMDLVVCHLLTVLLSLLPTVFSILYERVSAMHEANDNFTLLVYLPTCL